MHTKPRDLHSAINRINQDIINWASANKLKVNPTKTTAMILSTTKYVNFIDYHDLPQIVVNDNVIFFRDKAKYLGLMISSTLMGQTSY